MDTYQGRLARQLEPEGTVLRSEPYSTCVRVTYCCFIGKVRSNNSMIWSNYDFRCRVIYD